MNKEKRVLVRIDDVGTFDPWTAHFLNALCSADIHVSCGVVPLWLTTQCRDSLIELAIQFPGCLEIHQHGYSHTNHSDAPDKYEFGPGRQTRQQMDEILEGRRILEAAFGSIFYAAFSPPFGWCDLNLMSSLSNASFAAVSGLGANTTKSQIPVFSPDVDCFLWDPIRERPWNEIALDWKSRRNVPFGGVVLHPRFMTRESIQSYSIKLPKLLKKTKTLTFAQLVEHISSS